MSACRQLRESADTKGNLRRLSSYAMTTCVSDQFRKCQRVPPINLQSGDFGLGSGVIPHLLFTSAHCHDPELRQQVISLLKRYPGYEGDFDSRIASNIAHRISEIEKQDSGVPEAVCEAIPKVRRIRVLSLSLYTLGAPSINAVVHFRSPVLNQDGNFSSTIRIRLSFLQCLPTAPEISIVEDWMDETGTSIPVGSNSSCFDTRSISSKYKAVIVLAFISTCSRVFNVIYGDDELLKVWFANSTSKISVRAVMYEC